MRNNWSEGNSELGFQHMMFVVPIKGEGWAGDVTL